MQRFARRFSLPLVGALCCLLTTPTITAAQSCAEEPANLTAWWPGNGSGDDIRGDRHANLMDGASFGSGLVGQAFALDGVNDYVEVPHHASLNVGSGDFSVSLWVNFNNTSGEQVLIEKWIDGGGGSGWTLTKLGSNQIQLAMVGTGNPTSSVQTIPTSTWIHFAARRSGGTAAVFMNGAQIVSGAVSSNLDSPTSLKIGRRGDERGFFLKGRADEVHLYVGHALSNAEIAAIHAAGAEGICDDPVCGDGVPQGDEECDDGNLVPEDGCENDCTLSCGNGIHGGTEECDDGNRDDDDGCDSNCTITGCGNGIQTSGETCDDGNQIDEDACKSDCTPNVCGDAIVNPAAEECDDGNANELDGCRSDCTIGEVCIDPPANLLSWWPGDDSLGDIWGGRNAQLRNGASYAPGKVGNAFALDGVDDFVNVPSHPLLNVGSGDFTVLLWVRFAATANEQVLIEKYVEKFNPAAGSGWTLTKLGNDRVRFVALTHSVDSPKLALSPGTWVHFAARRSGTELAVFFNGVRVATGFVPVTVDLSSSASLKFGHRGSPANTPGSTDTRGFYLNGHIDEVHFFGRALSDIEVSSIRNTGEAGLCAPIPVCGNGLTEAGEVCDDGNAIADDGCEDDCTASCGNGVISGDEQCDDGNLIDGDGCDANCTVTGCGNGIATAGEECDDGNVVDGDGCDANCTLTACGNGIRTASSDEQCDDGNLDDGDGCESDCGITPIEEEVAPGGTVTTDPDDLGATPQAPIQIALTSPNGGTVGIATSDQPLTPAGVVNLVQDLLIQAPNASIEEPLRIVLRIDASAIPPGVDLLRIDLVREGINLPDCNGPDGHATPDPCLYDREELDDGDIVMTALTSKASRWNAAVRGLGKSEQKCVNGTYKAAHKVAKAQDRVNAACLKAATSGKQPDFAACVAADSGEKVAKAQAKLLAYVDKACSAAPPFGFAGGSEANDAAEVAKLALLADLFGDLNDAAIVDKARAKCQAAVVKEMGKVFDAKLKIFLGCATRGFAGKSSLFIANPNLATCFDVVDADVDSKAAKSMGKLAGALIKSCTADVAAALPGICATANDRSYCLETRLDCRLCRMLNATSGTERNCDAFDDGEVNSSCP